MRRKLLLPMLLVLVLSELGTLNLTIPMVSAAVSPYIAVVPESTVDSALTPGMNYTISIYTDYNGSDINGYGFGLTYDPNVLEGIEVVNGDLIADDTMFLSVGFNNTAGRLMYTNNFLFSPSKPRPLTSGPGTLANVTFRVVAKGTSNVTLEDQGMHGEHAARTRLYGYLDDGWGDSFNIIDSATMPDHIQHGFFDNRFQHDVAVGSVIAPVKAVVGELVPINVTVANIGKSAEVANVTIRYDTTYIDSQNVTLAVGASETVSFSWNTTDVPQSPYTINATATIEGDLDLQDNKNTTTILLVEQDVTVVNVIAPDVAVPGELVPINVTVANIGKSAEVANVTIRYDTTYIDSQNVTLAVGASETVSFSWNTTGVAQGNHTINATATIDDDGDLTDNRKNTPILIAKHDVAVEDISPPPSTQVIVGELVTISVGVKNHGGYTETFQVNVTYDTGTIGEPQQAQLDPNKYDKIHFTWNTTGVALGSYTIRAEAILSEDVNPDNNLMTTSIDVDPLLGGTVTNALTGGPILGTTVTANGYSATTDAGGHYTITDVPPGTYTVTASATGYESASQHTITVIAGEYTTVNFALRVVSAVTISADPANITVGNNTTLSGSISPILGGLNVTIQYKLKEEEVWNNLTIVTTNESGQYSHVWAPETPGTYEVKASWPGDDTTSPAESNVQLITVQEPPSSTPSYIYIVAAGVAAIIVAAAFYFLRSRKPKIK
jgi:hypothetical protein